MRKINIVLAIVLISSLALVGCGTNPSEPVGLTLYTEAGVDPNTWVLVEAGPYLKGQHEHDGMVDYDFEMMATEVTNSQYAKYLGEALAAGTIKIQDNVIMGYYPGDTFEGGKHEEEINAGDYPHMDLVDPATRIQYDGTNFTVKSGYENHPVTMVTWFGALAYADFYGYRLPSEDEWQKAARGTDNRPFPWGYESITHNHANYYHSGDPFETAERYSDTTPVGFYNGSTYGDFKTIDNSSPYGIYDMSGNVGEWTGDKIYQYHYRHIRGGNKGSYEVDLRLWKYDSATPTHTSPGVGFRVVRDPQ